MASTEITRIIDNARFKLPGALDAALKFELFAVLNEFFQDTNIWTEDIQFQVTPTTVSYLENPDEYTYELTVLADGVINRLMALVDSSGVSQSGVMPIPGTIILSRSPSKSDFYTARVAKTVTDPTDSDGYPVCPTWVLNKYGNDVLDGLVGRMMGQIAKPYSSPQVAMVHLRNFKQSINKAKAEAMHANVYRGQSWTFPRSFSARRY